MQVKSGAQCEVKEQGQLATISVETEHYVYWARQPVPVFLALVPSTGTADCPDCIYIVDFSEYVVCGVFNALTPEDVPKTVTLKSSHVIRVGHLEDIGVLVAQLVPRGHALLQSRYGVIGATPAPYGGYIYTTPFFPVSRVRTVILDQIRRTSVLSLIFLL